MTKQEKRIKLYLLNPLILLVGQGRIELPTLGFSDRTTKFSNLLILYQHIGIVDIYFFNFSTF